MIKVLPKPQLLKCFLTQSKPKSLTKLGFSGSGFKLHYVSLLLLDVIIKSYCKTFKKNLILFFQNLNTRFNLINDVWMAPHSCIEYYICVITHCVDPDSWQMMIDMVAFDIFCIHIKETICLYC